MRPRRIESILQIDGKGFRAEAAFLAAERDLAGYHLARYETSSVTPEAVAGTFFNGLLGPS